METFKRIGLVLLVLVAIVAGAAFWAGNFLDDSQEELSQATRTIIVGIAKGKWSRETMLQFSSPKLKQWIIDNNYNEFTKYATLGPVKEFLGIRNWKQKVGLDKTGATLRAGVIYEFGGADIQMSLSKIDGQWLLNKFKVRVIEPKPEASRSGTRASANG